MAPRTGNRLIRFRRTRIGRFKPFPRTVETQIVSLIRAGTFSKGRLKSLAERASFEQIAKTARGMGIEISSAGVRNVSIRNNLHIAGEKSSAKGKAYLWSAKKRTIWEYVHSRVLEANKSKQGQVAISVNELIGVGGRKRIVSGVKSKVDELLEQVLTEGKAEFSKLGVKVVRATTSFQHSVKDRLEGNYAVARDFVFSLSVKGKPVSPKLLRRVFGFSNSTASQMIERMKTDKKLQINLASRDAKMMFPARGIDYQINVAGLKKVWASRIEKP